MLQSMSSPVHSFNELPGDVSEPPATPSLPLRDITRGLNTPSTASSTPAAANVRDQVGVRVSLALFGAL